MKRDGLAMTTGAFIYGAGGHSLVVMDLLHDLGIEVLGIFADAGARHPRHGQVNDGVRVVGPEPFRALDMVVAMGIGNNAERAEVARLLPARFLTVVHSSAIIASTATVGEGTVILHGAIVQSNAVIGRHVLINTAASVDHDNTIGDYAHISPHATLCGHVEIGEGTHVGAGAILIPKIKVGAWSTIGAGAVVIRDVPDGATVVGNPGRIVPNAKGQQRPTWSGSQI